MSETARGGGGRRVGQNEPNVQSSHRRPSFVSAALAQPSTGSAREVCHKSAESQLEEAQCSSHSGNLFIYMQSVVNKEKEMALEVSHKDRWNNL